jgi:predicted nucleotidyltransferase
MTKQLPNFRALHGIVADRILHAAFEASKALRRADVKHALIGGLAVGAYGYPRATKDVDFLIEEAGFEHHPGGIVTFRPGVPVSVDDVPIDLLSDEVLEEQAEDPYKTKEGLPIVDPEALVYLKLRAWRRRDQEDVIELLKAGMNDRLIRKYLENVVRVYGRPELLTRFDELVERTDAE